MSYVFSRDAGGTIFIESTITGISLGLGATDYALMRDNILSNPSAPFPTTATQRNTIKSILSQINPLPTNTTLNGAVLNLASDNASQTTNLTNQLNVISTKIDNLPH